MLDWKDDQITEIVFDKMQSDNKGPTQIKISKQQF